MLVYVLSLIVLGLAQAYVPHGKVFQWKNNVNVHYVEAGTTGPPLLLLPGFGVGTYHFDRNIEELQKHFRVYSFDLLGQGKSWPVDGVVDPDDKLQYSVDTWTQQVIAFIENVIGESAHIAGNSLGGYLSICASRQRPDIVKSTILLNATPFWGFNKKDSIKIWDGILPAPKPVFQFGSWYFNLMKNPKTVKSMLAGVYANKEAYDDKLISEIIESASHPGGADAFTSIIFSPKASEDFDDMLVHVKTPICMVYGKDDPWVVPYWAQRLKRVRPEAVYFELTPSGHCPHHEAPVAVNTVIKQWVDVMEGCNVEEGRKIVSKESIAEVVASSMEVDTVQQQVSTIVEHRSADHTDDRDSDSEEENSFYNKLVSQMMSVQGDYTEPVTGAKVSVKLKDGRPENVFEILGEFFFGEDVVIV
jgi:pimeloyl-ACP methyl ester carboxylesterase